jgi:F-type H+-transporting ATPase subunit delta
MARSGSSARRYAEALFQIAERDGAVEAWLQQLDTLGDALGGEGVTRMLENPAVPAAQREALVGRVVADAAPQLRNLVQLLLRRGRIDLAPRVAVEFRRLYNRREGITTAIVTSHAPLGPDERAALEGRLGEMTGGRVRLSYHVDEALIGGVAVRLGDRLIDGSVRGRLERLRTQLAASAR